MDIAINLRIDEALHKRLVARAKANHRTMAGEIRDILYWQIEADTRAIMRDEKMKLIRSVDG